MDFWSGHKGNATRRSVIALTVTADEQKAMLEEAREMQIPLDPLLPSDQMEALKEEEEEWEEEEEEEVAEAAEMEPEVRLPALCGHTCAIFPRKLRSHLCHADKDGESLESV